jgi:mRNA interferase HigB
MNLVAPKALREFIEQSPESLEVMRNWYNQLRKIELSNFANLKEHFGSLDLAFTKNGIAVAIFDVGGNKYRAVVKIDYASNIAFIWFLFTHAEYDDWNRKGRPE